MTFEEPEEVLGNGDVGGSYLSGGTPSLHQTNKIVGIAAAYGGRNSP